MLVLKMCAGPESSALDTTRTTSPNELKMAPASLCSSIFNACHWSIGTGLF
jgi:hypothetical protein